MKALHQLAVWRIAPELRYLISGTALAVLAGLLIRGIDRLLQPLTVWKHFSGTITAAEHRSTDTILTVSFTDSSRIQHTVVFPAVLPDHQSLKADSPLHFVMLRTMFESGNAPHDAAHASDAEGKILTVSAYRRLIRQQILRELTVQLLIWLIAALICAAAIRLCFPNP